mmetsp:Transcript_19432/g.45231  ORF Transcript_19432/g.45231 Transcript_19432/m.45231 type:complete len:755 (-) Transcript_19432:59-2323(-)|eukprot:CAMPEP_0178396096 /NCGR_PEP_ID=MMETSP0689_2-20121128/13556_1 /TAXON_ID=160604 /ORGANISM="Amphidinium massartii, Strain CS-259" /LENGTH=754 /DNA_ID=CAMNT_0020016767 /DNA_START=163 /DNA_END=2427 /DNA_ORIENTATION=-
MSSILGFFSSASSTARARSTGSPSPRTETYSLEGLRKLYDSLAQFRTNNLEKNGASEALIETVREITEALVWGEQHDHSLFDYFCEKSILAHFIRVLGMKGVPRDVIVQLLQTLSMLMQNLRRTTSVYYMLSNNRVNNLITTPLDLSDEEVLAYYVTLLKSLAVRLDSETIKFYFLSGPAATRGSDPSGSGSAQTSGVEPASSFPLYTEAMKLINHRDQMVRTTVRAITLQVYRLHPEDPNMHSFLLKCGEESYFEEMAQHLQELWSSFQAAVSRADTVAMEDAYELQQEFLTYLADVFDLGSPELNEALAKKLLQVTIYPSLMPPLLRSEDFLLLADKDSVPVRTSLFLLREVLDTIKAPALRQPLLRFLLRSEGGDSKAVASECLKALLLCLEKHAEEAVVLLASSAIHATLKEEEGSKADPSNTQIATDQRVLHLLFATLSRSMARFHRSSVRALAHFFLEMFLQNPPMSPEMQELQKSLSAAEQEQAERLRRTVLARSQADSSVDELVIQIPDFWDVCSKTVRPPLIDKKIYDICHDLRWLQAGTMQEELALMERLGDVGAAIHDLVVVKGLKDAVSTSEASAKGHSAEFASLHLPGEAACAEDFHEGTSVDVNKHRKIVCGVSATNNKVTRYFLCNDYLMLLAQPSLQAVGKASITTRWPLRQVDADAPGCHDHSSRTLHLALNTVSSSLLERGATTRTAGPSTSITLNFEDAQSCAAAKEHILRRRQVLSQEVRAHVLDSMSRHQTAA